MRRIMQAALAVQLLGTLAACGSGGSSGPSADDIAKLYIADPGAGGGNDGAYSNWKVIQCQESGGKAAYECDFSFRFLESDRTARARFLKTGDRWIMSNLVRP